MITRRTMWQMLGSLPLIAAVANRAAARALYKQEQSKNP